MSDDDKKILAGLLLEASIIYHREIPPQLLAIYAKHLQKHSVQDIVKGFHRHFKVGKFFPSVADIVCFMPSLQELRFKNGKIFRVDDEGRERVFINPPAHVIEIQHQSMKRLSNQSA